MVKSFENFLNEKEFHFSESINILYLLYFYESKHESNFSIENIMEIDKDSSSETFQNKEDILKKIIKRFLNFKFEENNRFFSN